MVAIDQLVGKTISSVETLKDEIKIGFVDGTYLTLTATVQLERPVSALRIGIREVDGTVTESSAKFQRA